jgi:hypothetical protein
MTGLGFEPRTYGLKARRQGGTGVHERTLLTQKRASATLIEHPFVTLGDIGVQGSGAQWGHSC